MSPAVHVAVIPFRVTALSTGVPGAVYAVAVPVASTHTLFAVGFAVLPCSACTRKYTFSPAVSPVTFTDFADASALVASRGYPLRLFAP